MEEKENDLTPPTPGNMAATKSPQFKVRANVFNSYSTTCKNWLLLFLFHFDRYRDGRSYNTLEKNCVELE